MTEKGQQIGDLRLRLVQQAHHSQFVSTFSPVFFCFFSEEQIVYTDFHPDLMSFFHPRR